MTDSNATKSRLPKSITNPAFDTSKIIKNATTPFQDSMERVTSNVKTSLDAFNTVALSPLQKGMKTTLDTLNATASKPIQDIIKQQENISRMFRGPESSLIEMSKPLTSPTEVQWSMPKKQWHQLIVLGNGFDLECGLHSKFTDFARLRYSVFDLYENDFLYKPDQFMRDHNLTLWDLILYRETKKYWYDIESTIEHWITSHNDDGETPCSRISNILNNQKDTLWRTMFSSDAAQTEKFIAKIIRSNFNSQDAWTSSEIATILFSELNKLEKAFCEYLRNEVKVNESYNRNALNLLSLMLMAELPDEDCYDVSASLLDFNYTNPLAGADIPAESHTESRPFPTLVNIHGSLRENNIVFGIDGTKHMDEPDALPFTKTYRLLSLDNPDTAKLIHTHSPHGLKDDSTAMIKFYGHSLAQADYAYFQAIFDGVDLYESQTRLIFFYRPWKEDDGTRVSDAEARADMNRKVAGLLSTYGSTLDNKDHGKNLMHKLLIEGRLSVKTI